MSYVISLASALLLNATANILMKVGMKTVATTGGLLNNGPVSAIKTVFTNTTLLIGLICFGLNAAFYMYALQSKALKISVAYPLMVGGGYALIAIVARFHPALHERLTMGQFVGIALILTGVILVATGSHAEAG